MTAARGGGDDRAFALEAERDYWRGAYHEANGSWVRTLAALARAEARAERYEDVLRMLVGMQDLPVGLFDGRYGLRTFADAHDEVFRRARAALARVPEEDAGG